VQSLIKFSTIEEVIERANSTIYGLAAGVVTKDISTAFKLSHAIRAGTIWVNTYNFFNAALPFGGYNLSGIGREGGPYVLQNYTEVKVVIIKL